MVFRCPTCGRFVKARQVEGSGEYGKCENCEVHYLAMFSECITESEDYNAWLTVWPCPNQTEGKTAKWRLRGDW